jgi:hypothetical protein
VSVWTLADLEAIVRRRRGEPVMTAAVAYGARRGVPDAVDACRTPPRPAGPTMTRVSLFAPRNSQFFPMPDDARRALYG